MATPGGGDSTWSKSRRSGNRLPSCGHPKLPPNEQARIAKKIDALSNDPRPSGIKALKGNDLMRLRVGDYPIIYQIEDDRLVVLIVKLGHRREVYRWSVLSEH